MLSRPAAGCRECMTDTVVLNVGCIGNLRGWEQLRPEDLRRVEATVSAGALMLVIKKCCTVMLLHGRVLLLLPSSCKVLAAMPVVFFLP